MAVLPGHRRPGVPSRLRRRADARDRALLGLPGALRPRAGTLRDPRRDGARRVPRALPGRRGGRAAQQRIHQRHGRVDRRDRPRVLDLLPASRRAALRARLGLTDDELRTWQDMSRRMFVPFHGEDVISQFEGYADLEELDWARYRSEHDNIQRLDRILKAEGEDPARYQLTKQADAVMLFFLFPPDELRRLFEQLGYAHDSQMARRTVDYYDRRTSHGSTLSLITHAGVLAALDPESSWERFMAALESDVGDVQGGTTKEGIHMGVMSGTLDLLQRSYLGCSVRDGVLHFEPRLVDRLDGLAFSMQFRGTSIRISVKADELTVLARAEGFRAPVRIAVGDQVRELGAGDDCAFALPPQPDPANR